MIEQAGVRFEQLVAGALRRLGVAFWHDERFSRVDVEDKIDIQIWRESDGQLFEIQLTLLHGNHRKIASFAAVSIARDDRGICVYVDVEAPRIRYLENIAARTAKMIQQVINNIQDFGPYNLIGIRVSAENDGYEIFWPHMFLTGSQLSNALWTCGKVHSKAAVKETAQTTDASPMESAVPATTEAPVEVPSPPTRPHSPMFWRILVRDTVQHAPWTLRDRIHNRHARPHVAHRPYHRLAA